MNVEYKAYMYLLTVLLIAIDVTKLVKIRIRHMQILTFKIR